jgi:hypothetical protein
MSNEPVTLRFDKFGEPEEVMIVRLLKRGLPFNVIFTPTPSEKEQNNGTKK